MCYTILYFPQIPVSTFSMLEWLDVTIFKCIVRAHSKGKKAIGYLKT